jgi:Tol biopolymer transport system component
VASIDGYEEPVWLGSTGELLVRDPDTKAMYVVGTDLRTVTRLANLVSATVTGAYNASADGRTIVYQSAASTSTVLAYDRSSRVGWLAANDKLSDLKSPVLSPDGRFMAVISRDLLVTRPHIISFATNLTVEVEDQYAIRNSIAECRGRMGWAA